MTKRIQPYAAELENISAALLFFGNAISSVAQCGRLGQREADQAEIMLSIIVDKLDETWNGTRMRGAK